MTENSTPKYASFGLRVFASIIDTVLSSFVVVPAYNIYKALFGESERYQMLAYKANSGAALTSSEAIELFTTTVPSMTFQSLIVAIVIIIFWVYRAATPGKMVLSMVIVDEKTLEKPSKKQCIIRYLGYFPAIIFLGLGLVWVHFDKKHQGWHDKLAKTVVIVKK